MRLAMCLIMVGLTAGCAHGSEVARDCSVLVRYQGVVYKAEGFRDRASTDVGPAMLASCHDVGQNASGPSFEDAEDVRVGSFTGFSSDEVVGVDQGGGRTRLLVAVLLPEARKKRLMIDLQAS